MATLSVLPPRFKMTGSQKEPPRLSRPIGTGAVFLEHDFVVLAVAPGPPDFNSTQINPPTSIDATIANTGGSIAAGTYYAAITYVNANGETTGSPDEALTTTGTGTVTCESPPPSGDATGYRLYLGSTPTALFRSGSTVLIGTAATATTIPSTNPIPTTNTTALAAPAAATLSAGGTTGPNFARTEYYILTYVNEVGETVGSTEASQAATAGQLVTVTAPGVSGDATGYNVYASYTSGLEVRQNATPIAVTTNWVEPTTGLVLQGVQRAVANQPGLINGFPCIVGCADHDYNATYGGPAGGVQPGGITPFGRPVWNQSVFGPTEQYPGIATEPANAHIISATVQYEICLKQAWDPGNAGSLGGLALDSGSGYFIFDLTASNQIAQLVEPVDGPGYGVPGDINKRVAIKFLGQYVTGS